MRNSLTTRFATQHLKLTVLGGAALTPLFGLVFSILMYRPWAKHWPSATSSITEGGLQAMGVSASLLIGSIPALVAALLRLLPMRWLLERATLLPKYQGIALALTGTLLLFETTVVLPSLFGAWALKIPFPSSWSICTGFSLPWLVAALWATWRVLPSLAPPAFVVE